jgi:urease accessory protein
MDAEARVVAEADGRGGTRLAVLRGQAPLLLRRTDTATSTGTDAAQVHLVGGAAGPLGGDTLRIHLEVGPGAALRIHTVAASVALPGHTGGASSLAVDATVAAGGHLTWLPEPLVAAARCHHAVRCTIGLAEGAHLTWRDELVCGRHDERPGDVMLTTRITRNGRPLLHHRLAVGPGAPGWDGPAVLGGARATGSLLMVNPAWADEWASGRLPPSRILGSTAAMVPLGSGPAVLATAIGADAGQVRAHLDAALEHAPRPSGPYARDSYSASACRTAHSALSHHRRSS